MAFRLNRSAQVPAAVGQPAVRRQHQALYTGQPGQASTEPHYSSRWRQQGLNWAGLLIGILPEDQNLRMVIKSEGLLGVLIINRQRADGGIGFKGSHQVKTESPFEHARLSPPDNTNDIYPQRAPINCGIDVRG